MHMREDDEIYWPMSMVPEPELDREPWPPIGRKLCPDCTAPNKPPDNEWHRVRGVTIVNWCQTCDGYGHVKDWQYKGIMEMTNDEKQTKLNGMLNDTVLDFARAFGVDLETALAALDDAKSDAPVVLSEMVE